MVLQVEQRMLPARHAASIGLLGAIHSTRRDGKKPNLECFRAIPKLLWWALQNLRVHNTELISLETQVEGRALETKRRLGLSKTSISIAFGGWGRCAKRDVPRDAKKHHLGSSGKHWFIFALFIAVDEFVFCRQHGWSRVAPLNLYLIHVHVVYTEAGQSFMAVARIEPASSRGILLCANCTWGLLNLQSPSKQRIQCVRLKDKTGVKLGGKAVTSLFLLSEGHGWALITEKSP